jgi:hypothetical protein
MKLVPNSSMNTLRRATLLLALLATAACVIDDPFATEPGPGNCRQPAGQGVLGLGCVPHRYTSEVAVRGGWAYTGTWGGSRRRGNLGNVLYVWDVTGDRPALRDSVVVPDVGTLGDVQISDDGRLLVLATEYSPGSIVVYDLADPVRPRQLSRFSSANTGAGVHTVKLGRVQGRLYAFLSANPAPSPRLVVVDLADPANPREVLAQTMGTPFLHDVFVRDGLLFTALWNEGMSIWDIGGGTLGGSPSAPRLIGDVRTVGGSVHNIWWFHDPGAGSRRYAFVGEERPGTIGASSAGDLHVVDVGDPANPREVAFYNVPGAGAHNFWMDEESGILYAAFYNGGVRALDVRGDLGTCAAAQRAPDGRCDLRAMGRERAVFLTDTGSPVYVWGVQWVGAHLYASDMLNGLWKLDVFALRR